jgi:large subunit ribosomal protein L15
MKTLLKLKINKKRLGRGYGSGKGGHTSSRGQKGQKSRSRIGILFEGVKMKKSFIKRLPFIRGKGKNNLHQKPLILNLNDLNNFPKDIKTVSVKSLTQSGTVDSRKAKKFGIKILGGGELKNKLSFELPVSKTAALKIKKAGGEIIGR